LRLRAIVRLADGSRRQAAALLDARSGAQQKAWADPMKTDMLASPKASMELENTRYAVLGSLLQQGPVHGYALIERIRALPLAADELPSKSSVYRALTSLSNDGLVELLPDAGEEPGTLKKTFGATEEGELQFERWLGRAPSSYEDLLTRIWAARRRDLPALIAFVVAAELQCRDRLEAMPVYDAALLYAFETPWHAIAAQLTTRIAAAELATRAQVLGRLRDDLRGLQSQSAPWGS
jgi:DNA-binding PadR family transcriptional regulator